METSQVHPMHIRVGVANKTTPAARHLACVAAAVSACARPIGRQGRAVRTCRAPCWPGPRACSNSAPHCGAGASHGHPAHLLVLVAGLLPLGPRRGVKGSIRDLTGRHQQQTGLYHTERSPANRHLGAPASILSILQVRLNAEQKEFSPCSHL